MTEHPQAEETRCPLCAAAATSPGHYPFPPYTVVRCAGCGLWYLSPRLRPDLMQAIYADHSYFEGGSSGYSSYAAQERTLRLTFRRLLRGLAGQGMTGGALLEIGCAYGLFLDEARPFFGRRVGTDLAPEAIERAQGRADQLLVGGLERLGATDIFDCIACIHVIEHIYEPVEFLRRAFGHLRPGGWLVVATPDMGSWWRPVLGRRWPFFKIPEHVTYFDRATLTRLLGAAGGERVRTVAYPSFFTLELIGEKLGVGVPRALGKLDVRMPRTTVALAAEKP